MPQIHRDASGAAVALSWAKGESACAPEPIGSVATLCARASCGKPVPRRARKHGCDQRFCSTDCRRMAWEEAHPRVKVAAQQALDFTPPVARADDAQAARLQRKALLLLGALQAGPLTNVEAMHIGGLRFGARLHELRRAGHRIQTEEHKATGVTVYRLVIA